MFTNKLKLNVEKMQFVFICIYLLYTTWFQYAIKSIDGILSALGIIILLLSLKKIKLNKEFYRGFIPIALFIVLSVFDAVFITDNAKLSFVYVVKIIKYCIPFYGIVVYIKNRNRFRNIMVAISISSFLIAVTSFFKTVYFNSYLYNEQYIQGTLNANVFSSYMMLGIMAATFLFASSKNKLRFIYIVFIGIEVLAQLNAASRRGIIVCIFLVTCFLHTIITINEEKKTASRVATIMLVAVGLFVLLNESSYLASRFLGIQRILGEHTGGDVARQYYKAVALEIFTKSPVVGKGLGAVELSVGMYSHSLYYELLACTGIIGTIILLSFLINIAIRFARISRKKNGSPQYVRIETRLGFWYIITLFMCGVAVVLIYDSYFYVMLAIFVSQARIINAELKVNDLEEKH